MKLPAQLVLYGVGYLAAATVGQWPTLSPGLTATLWAPSGLSLAVLLVADRRDWWAFATVGYLADVFVEATVYDFSLTVSAVVALGNILEPIVGASLVRWRSDAPFRLSGVREILDVAVFSALASTAISATLGALMVEQTIGQPYGLSWLLWWAGDAVGVLVVAPLVLAFARDSGGLNLQIINVAEILTILTGLIGTSHIVFSNSFPFPFVIYPFLGWAAIRFGIKGSSVAIAILAAMTFAHITAGYQLFASPDFDAAERTLVAQAFLAVVSVSTHLLAAVTEQRNAALANLHKLAEGLEVRVSEQTALLREREERLRLALEGAGAAEWSWDIDTNTLGWSDRYRTLYGFAKDSRPEFSTWLASVHPDDRERLKRRVAQMLKAGDDDIWREEFRIIHPDRGVVWLGGTALMRRNEAGEPKRMTGINYDITSRREAEHQLRLHQATQARLARLGALGELSAGISHEITQPLMAAGTYARLANDILSHAQPDIVLAAQAARDAAAQIERASKVVQGLRELIQHGRISTAAVRVSKIVDQVIELMRPEIERSGTSIVTKIPDDLPDVKADALQIEQVFINLVRNAIDAVCGNDAQRRSIWIEAVAKGAMVEFCVRDDGPGFAAELVGQTPQNFLTTKDDGLGLGLSLSASIVTAHGGHLWIGPNNPGGTLYFTLLRDDGSN